MAEQHGNRTGGGMADPEPWGGDGTVRGTDTGSAAGAAAGGEARSETGSGSGAQTGVETGPVRVDRWIWSVRLIKSRSLASTAAKAGHVRVNGERAKPAQSVKVGDEVRLYHAGRERIVIVRRLLSKRVGAPVAVQAYVDNSPPPPPRQDAFALGVRDRGAGRPTKRDRRELERLRLLGNRFADPGRG